MSSDLICYIVPKLMLPFLEIKLNYSEFITFKHYGNVQRKIYIFVAKISNLICLIVFHEDFIYTNYKKFNLVTIII